MQGLDRRVLDSVELVVCLDSLGAGDAVHMHYSKKPMTPEIRALYGSIEEAAEGAGVRLEKHQHKINIADPATRWQHEQFVRGARHLVAVTLSGRAAAHEGGQFGGGPGMTDRAVDADVLRRNVRFVAEALGRVVYGGGVEVASGAHGVSDEFLGAYTRFMASQPRSAVHFEKTSPVLAELERVLRRHATDVARRVPARHRGPRVLRVGGRRRDGGLQGQALFLSRAAARHHGRVPRVCALRAALLCGRV